MTRARLTSLAALVLALAGGLLTACGDLEITTGPFGISIFGTYALETVNGSSLPFVVFQVGDDEIEITAASVRLNSDNTYSTSFTFSLSEDGPVTTATEDGTFSVTGTTIEFTDSAGTFTGSISGKTLTIIDEGGLTFVFHK